MSIGVLSLRDCNTRLEMNLYRQRRLNYSSRKIYYTCMFYSVRVEIIH